jgi:hypothetical protein
VLGVYVLAGLETRGWRFNVAFLRSFGFFHVFFFCFGVLVYSLYALGAPLRLFMLFLLLPIKKKLYIKL